MEAYPWKSSPVVTRYEGNPILKPEDMPFPSTMVYNPGVEKFKGRYVMLFRNLHYQVRWTKRTHFLGWATSDDGVHWTVDADARFEVEGLTGPADPRLTVLDGRCYACVQESENVSKSAIGIRGAVTVSDDLEHWELLSLSTPDNRNMVLFPERVNGRIARLERPFRKCTHCHTATGEAWYSESPDGRYWGNSRRVLAIEDVPFANEKTGPGAAPIRTDKGWLALFHAVYVDPKITYPTWRNEDIHWVYAAGVMLLDLDDPSKIIGLAREPLIVPEAPYDCEIDGYRSYTVFPTGNILEDDGTVKIYYGAADSSICLATAKLDDLIALCTPV